MKLFRRPVILALVGLVVASLAGYGVYRWSERYLDAARAALKRRDDNAARTALQLHLEAHPSSAEGHLLLAQLDRRSNRYDEAAQHLEACRRLGGPADAIELERALGAIQNGVFSRELEEVCTQYLRRKDADKYLILEAFSQGLSKTYRLKEALVCLEEMLVLEPESGYALRRRGWIHFRLGDYDRAEADYRRAVEIDPSDAVARQGLAQILLDIRKDASQAAEHYERLWHDRPDSTVALALARNWQLMGRTGDSRRLLDEWLSSHPDDAAVLSERGKLALEEDALDQAVTLLRRAVTLAPYLVDANYTLSQCLTRQGRTAEAEECQARIRRSKHDQGQLAVLTRRLTEAPDDADLRCQIAQLFLRLGQEEEGIRWLMATIQSHPNHRPSHLALAEYYDKTNQSSRAAMHRRMAGVGR
jgi:tetratricopeptide (TPR) repeat protein